MDINERVVCIWDNDYRSTAYYKGRDGETIFVRMASGGLEDGPADQSFPANRVINEDNGIALNNLCGRNDCWSEVMERSDLLGCLCSVHYTEALMNYNAFLHEMRYK